jgi:hypothetical protein
MLHNVNYHLNEMLGEGNYKCRQTRRINSLSYTFEMNTIEFTYLQYIQSTLFPTSKYLQGLDKTVKYFLQKLLINKQNSLFCSKLNCPLSNPFS